MADKYITNVQDILAGFECNTRKDGNPYDGERLGALRYYKGVKSYDIVSHDDEEALLFVVTDYHMLLVVAKEGKLTDMCSACVAEDANYHYEDRNGKIVLRADDKGKLIKRFLEMDWSYTEPEDDYDDAEFEDNSDEAEINENSDGEADDQFDIDKEAARQAELEKAQADLEKKAKADRIAASLRRADAEEAAQRAAARTANKADNPLPTPEGGKVIVARPVKETPAKPKPVDIGDLSDFE